MKKYILTTLLSLAALLPASAQSTLKSAYFADRMAMRHKLNPALVSDQGYVSIPMLGGLSFGTQSSIALDKFLFPLDNGKLGTFLHEDVDAGMFLDGLRENNFSTQTLNATILSTGFFAWNGFNTIDISLKHTSTINLKKDIFEMMKVGQDGDTVYDLAGSRVKSMSYGEIAFGHARRINSNITVGAKFKVLLGAAYADMELNSMKLEMSEDLWRLDVAGGGYAAAMGSDLSDTDNIEPAGLGGFGLAADFGMTYENLCEGLTLSAALTDFGFISWKMPHSMDVAASTEFSGFEDLEFDDFEGSTEQTLDDMEADLESLTDAKLVAMGGHHASMLSATLNVGAEYEIFEDKFSAGLLSSTTFGPRTITEFMLSANYSPASWFNMSLTGSATNYGCYWGWLINLCPGKGLGLYLGMDHMVGALTPQYFPIGNASVDFTFGLNVPLGRGKL